MNTQTIHQSPRAGLAHASANPSTVSAVHAGSSLRSTGSAPKRLSEAQSAAQAGAKGTEALLSELLSLPAQVVGSLPAAVSIQLRVPGAPVPVVLWTGRLRDQSRQATPVLASTIVFDGAELDAIVTACEADRLWHSDFLGLCFEKWRRPETPVRAAQLLDGANPDEAVSWTFGRVLARLGLEIEAIELDEQEPVARSLYQAA